MRILLLLFCLIAVVNGGLGTPPIRRAKIDDFLNNFRKGLNTEDTVTQLNKQLVFLPGNSTEKDVRILVRLYELYSSKTASDILTRSFDIIVESAIKQATEKIQQERLDEEWKTIAGISFYKEYKDEWTRISKDEFPVIYKEFYKNGSTKTGVYEYIRDIFAFTKPSKPKEKINNKVVRAIASTDNQEYQFKYTLDIIGVCHAAVICGNSAVKVLAKRYEFKDCFYDAFTTCLSGEDNNPKTAIFKPIGDPEVDAYLILIFIMKTRVNQAFVLENSKSIDEAIKEFSKFYTNLTKTLVEEGKFIELLPAMKEFLTKQCQNQFVDKGGFEHCFMVTAIARELLNNYEWAKTYYEEFLKLYYLLVKGHDVSVVQEQELVKQLKRKLKESSTTEVNIVRFDGFVEEISKLAKENSSAALSICKREKLAIAASITLLGFNNTQIDIQLKADCKSCELTTLPLPVPDPYSGNERKTSVTPSPITATPESSGDNDTSAQTDHSETPTTGDHSYSTTTELPSGGTSKPYESTSPIISRQTSSSTESTTTTITTSQSPSTSLSGDPFSATTVKPTASAQHSSASIIPDFSSTSPELLTPEESTTTPEESTTTPEEFTTIPQPTTTSAYKKACDQLEKIADIAKDTDLSTSEKLQNVTVFGVTNGTKAYAAFVYLIYLRELYGSDIFASTCQSDVSVYHQEIWQQLQEAYVNNEMCEVPWDECVSVRITTILEKSKERIEKLIKLEEFIKDRVFRDTDENTEEAIEIAQNKSISIEERHKFIVEILKQTANSTEINEFVTLYLRAVGMKETLEIEFGTVLANALQKQLEIVVAGTIRQRKLQPLNMDKFSDIVEYVKNIHRLEELRISVKDQLLKLWEGTGFNESVLTIFVSHIDHLRIKQLEHLLEIIPNLKHICPETVTSSTIFKTLFEDTTTTISTTSTTTTTSKPVDHVPSVNSPDSSQCVCPIQPQPQCPAPTNIPQIFIPNVSNCGAGSGGIIYSQVVPSRIQIEKQIIEFQQQQQYVVVVPAQNGGMQIGGVPVQQQNGYILNDATKQRRSVHSNESDTLEEYIRRREKRQLTEEQLYAEIRKVSELRHS